MRSLHGLPDAEARVQTESVRVLTFASLFEEYGIDPKSIDFLQIDAEGFDAEVLCQFDLALLRPPIVRFEHQVLSSRDFELAISSLIGYGYSIGLSLFDTLAYRP